MEPPRIFPEAEVLQSPGELWLVRKALYGLVTSPKDWCVHRDQKIKTFEWEIEGAKYKVAKTAQDDMWAIKSQNGDEEEWRLAGLCATYVDDIIIAGEEKVIREFHKKVREHWKIGEPSWVGEGREPVRFLGMEVEKRGRDFVIHQRAYLENLFLEYEEQGRSSLGNIKTPEEEDPPLAVDVARAQKETGELLWVAGRTRPDICLAVSLMCQWATKRPKGVIAIGAQVRAYLRETRDEGLLIQGGDEGDERAEETLGSVEVYSDASYASSNLKSLTGIVVCYGGTPIAWHTTRQAFVTLSTAEAELMSLLESLVTVRSTGALVEAVLERRVRLRMHSDSTAAIAIASGTTSSWRTRHLRIRAAGLTEALRSREVSLTHVAGTELVADGMTKQLTGQPLKNFKEALGLEKIQVTEKLEVKKIEIGKRSPDSRFAKGLGLLIAAMSLITSAEAADSQPEGGSGEWWILVLLTAAIAIIGDVLFRVGTAGVRRWMAPREELKVKLIHPEARLPTRGSEQAAGLDLYSVIETMVPSGDSVLVKTGIAIELPPGTYGRVAPRSSLAIRGIETGAGVIDRDFRGEVKVLLRNWSDEDLFIYKGDRVAQLVIEKILEVGVNSVENLTDTTRGSRGFGYSGHEEMYPWAEPDDPLYQCQELGTRNPVDRISIRTLRVGRGRGEATEDRSIQTEEDTGGGLSHEHQEVAGDHRVPDSELWCRGAYDAEAEERRRRNLGLGLSAWDRSMVRRGPQRNHGGTWVMMDSEGVHFVAHDPGDGRGPTQGIDFGARGSGGDEAPPQEGDQPPEERQQGRLPRVEPLRLVTTVEKGIVLGKWCHEEEMWDYLRSPGFQRGFINDAVLKVISTPPRRTAAKDSWDYLIDHDGGKKIGIRVHYQERKKLYDFEAKTLLEEEWTQWRMTVAWHLNSKRKTILMDERNGKKGCHLDLWWGYTLFKTK